MDFIQWINDVDWTRVFNIIDKFIKVLAVAIAGIWVYLNSIRGRTYVPRLKLELDAQIKTLNEKPYILVTMRAMNVGSSIVEVQKDGSGLWISGIKLGTRDALETVYTQVKERLISEHSEIVEETKLVNSESAVKGLQTKLLNSESKVRALQKKLFFAERKEKIERDETGKKIEIPNFPIFKLDEPESHDIKHIEPSSEFYEQKIIQYLPDESDAFRIELRVEVKSRKIKRRGIWFELQRSRVFRAITAVTADITAS